MTIPESTREIEKLLESLAITGEDNADKRKQAMNEIITLFFPFIEDEVRRLNVSEGSMMFPRGDSVSSIVGEVASNLIERAYNKPLLCDAVEIDGKLFNSETRLKSYIRRAIKNCYIDMNRQRKGEEAAYLDEEVRDESPGVSSFCARNEELEIAKEKMEEFLATLREPDQSIARLVYRDRLTWRSATLKVRSAEMILDSAHEVIDKEVRKHEAFVNSKFRGFLESIKKSRRVD